MGIRKAREDNIVARAALRQKIVELHVLGFQPSHIADTCGISRVAVRRLIEESEALGAIVSQQRRTRLSEIPKPTREDERRLAVYELRLAGYDAHEIALHLDLPVSVVQEYMFEELKLRMEVEAQNSELSRYISLARFEELVNALFSAALNGNLGAVDRLLKIEELRAKLTGTNTPVRVDIEQRLRSEAEKHGLDPESAVLAVNEILREDKQYLS